MCFKLAEAHYQIPQMLRGGRSQNPLPFPSDLRALMLMLQERPVNFRQHLAIATSTSSFPPSHSQSQMPVRMLLLHYFNNPLQQYSQPFLGEEPCGFVVCIIQVCLKSTAGAAHEKLMKKHRESGGCRQLRFAVK